MIRPERSGPPSASSVLPALNVFWGCILWIGREGKAWGSKQQLPGTSKAAPKQKWKKYLIFCRALSLGLWLGGQIEEGRGVRPSLSLSKVLLFHERKTWVGHTWLPSDVACGCGGPSDDAGGWVEGAPWALRTQKKVFVSKEGEAAEWTITAQHGKCCNKDNTQH